MMTLLTLGLSAGAIWLIIALIRVTMGIQRSHGFLPKPAPPDRWLTRGTEAVLLMTATFGIVLTGLAWYPHFNSHNSAPEILWWHKVVTAGILTLLAASVLLSLTWRLGPSLLLSIGGLFVYAYFADGGNYRKLVSANRPVPTPDECPYGLRTLDDLAGADLWINGVYFGQTPVKTTLGELLKLPEWELKGLDGQGRHMPDWTNLSVHWSVHNREDGGHDRKQRELYCLLKLNDELKAPGGGWHGSGPTLDYRGRKWTSGSTSFGYEFPKFNAELKQLVRWLQLHDYQVTDEWIAAWESYAIPGWNTLRAAAKFDPGCQSALEQIALKRYGATRDSSPDEAWQAIARIATEADEKLDYLSDSLPGIAVDLLGPKLDPQRLAHFARDWLVAHPKINNNSMSWGDRNGLFIFGPHPRSGPQEPGNAPRSVFVWAHAIWRLDQQLDQQDDSRDNPLEKILTPHVLINPVGPRVDRNIVKGLGGSVLDRWLMWELHHAKYPQTIPLGHESFNVNEWDLANRNSPAGKRWRADNSDKLEKFALAAMKTHSNSWPTQLDFLFLDFNGTTKSFAARFWPQFREQIVKEHGGLDASRLLARWEYLSRMEPLPTVEMYLNCWLDPRPEPHLQPDQLDMLKRLPQEKAAELLQRIVAQVDADLSENKSSGGAWKWENRHRVWRQFHDEFLVPAAERFERHVEKNEIHQVKQLLNRSFDDPLFAAIVDSKSVKTRQAIVDFLKDNPTSRHRDWLQKLATDADAEVRQAATQAVQELAQQPATTPRPRQFSPPAAKVGEVTFAEPLLESPKN